MFPTDAAKKFGSAFSSLAFTPKQDTSATTGKLSSTDLGIVGAPGDAMMVGGG